MVERLQLSPDQVEALERVRAWWEGEERQTFSLAGYAGTGKTTIIAEIIRAMEGSVAVAAPTGKAAQRLREKGVDACTIHQLAYSFTGYDAHGNPDFDFTGIRRKRCLVVVDEASMVNQRVHDDLVKEGYRMLFVGDHGQLAPVGGDPGIMRRPDFALSQIHRQDDAGLLDFAHALRAGDPLPEARGAVEKVWRDPRQEPEEVGAALRDADVVIAWRNATRHWLNHRIMQLRGLLPDDLRYDPRDAGQAVAVLRALGHQWFPVVCLQNNYRLRAFNGQVFDACVESFVEGSTTAYGLLREEGCDDRTVAFDLAGFRMQKNARSELQGHVLVDFGCCLTAHKSQGSEWPWVCVWDDTNAGMEDRARWQYTAATRAKERLTWIHQ